ncbi:protein-disulfide reductase DsbD domain-containing protein [Longitalea luteola]|uniref:protein-disulfide reductase DsbD domain-containing protein n=1 Tax=Longitalea luteola TaxID=2812563 RepID=UPI001A975C77|nr:protein-disulfide reductase DsbD domain-containing protein [Longitalea luteola]
MRFTTKLLFAALLLLSLQRVTGQILKPVRWSYGAKKTSATEAVVFIKATIDEGWHLYSQHVAEGGPVKTTFTFPASKEYTLNGSTQEPKPIVRMESAFNMQVAFFEKSVIFQQKIKLKKQQTTVKGSVEYMTCNDEKCLPPDTQAFSIPIK